MDGAEAQCHSAWLGMVSAPATLTERGDTAAPKSIREQFGTAPTSHRRKGANER